MERGTWLVVMSEPSVEPPARGVVPPVKPRVEEAAGLHV